eukprot:4961858-Lingulodinium_polyedra.AAC.1
MWGKPWRKATAFLHAFIKLHDLEARQCKGAQRGRCARTGLPHLQLCGRCPSGGWWTKVAEPYPRSMCTAL